jgi:hypothetical protein
MAEASIPLTLNAEAVAAIADLADAATGIRGVLERLEAREARQDEENRRLTPEEVEEHWREVLNSPMPEQLAQQLRMWFQGEPAPWAMYKLAQHYHWSR